MVTVEVAMHAGAPKSPKIGSRRVGLLRLLRTLTHAISNLQTNVELLTLLLRRCSESRAQRTASLYKRLQFQTPSVFDCMDKD